ncbi:MAG: hypothetical protein IJD51_01960 [Clostridia bacterium]|nr:hypothetical protein [Clostridia bacterium]
MKYRYQLHTHTSPCSRCAVMHPEDLAEGLYSQGLAGAVLTNHFFGGNSGIDRALGWEAFVERYERDYTECRAAAEKYGVDIIFSLEEHLDGGREVLCFGVTPEMLYKHPELMARDQEIWYNTLHGGGGLLIQAHPFRRRAYITAPYPLPLSHLDGIEIYNYGNTPEENLMAEEFAGEHPELILTAGADAHSTRTLSFGGIATDERIRDEAALCRILRSGCYEIFKSDTVGDWL